MILPSKYIREDEALLGVGAKILGLLIHDMPLSELWEKSKKQLDLGNFERFVLTLDMLYVMGLIVFDDNEIQRIRK